MRIDELPLACPFVHPPDFEVTGSGLVARAAVVGVTATSIGGAITNRAADAGDEIEAKDGQEDFEEDVFHGIEEL